MKSVLPALGSLDRAPLKLDPRTFDRALSCVHCGLCLPACPTYTTTHHEADSPRGRIQLMRALAEDAIAPTPSVQLHLDLCLDCRACETACPSGVVYHELIEETRARLAGDLAASEARVPRAGGLLRWMSFHILTHPTRLKFALLPVRILQKVGLYWLFNKVGLFKLLPSWMQGMLRMLPASGGIWPARPPEHVAARSSTPPPQRPPRVAFFTGCVGSVLYARVNRQAIELLSAAGCEVVTPPAQDCCGAIHHHNGAWAPAMDRARKNIEAMLAHEPDFITTAIAGCGAMLKEYDHLLRDDSVLGERARQFARKVRDIAEVLEAVGLPRLRHPVNATVAYHDACHLAHAQKVTDAPRRLLQQIPGVRLVPLPESDMCCGAAGTYNLTQPEMAATLAARKLQCIRSTGATFCAAGNVGCAMHIQAQARAENYPLRVVHPVELLHQSAFGD